MLLLLFRRVISTNYHPIREVVCTQFIYYRAESFSVLLLLNEPPPPWAAKMQMMLQRTYLSLDSIRVN